MKSFRKPLSKDTENNIIVYLVMFITVFLILMQSPLSPHGTGLTQYDSGVYSYTGWRMRMGEVPYLNAWDNKGPMLYFINMLGILINYQHGVWILELIFLYAAGLFCYKSLKLYSNGSVSLAATIFILLLLSSTLEGGNLTEEWSLPFCFISLYIFALYRFQDLKFKWYQVLVLGVCFGSVAFIRTNLVVIWLSFCFIFIIDTLLRKEVKLALSYIYLFALGTASIIVPFIIYLVYKGAWNNFIYAVYKSSMSFNSKTITQRIIVANDIIGNMDNSYILIFIVMFIVTSLFMIYSRKISNRGTILMVLSSIVAVFVNIYANTISGFSYPHYSMSFLPVLAFPVMCIFKGIYINLNNKDNDNSRIPGFAIICFLVLVLSWNNIAVLRKNIIVNISSSKGSAVVDYITANSGNQDELSVIGPPYFYYVSQRKAASSSFYVLAGDAFQSEVKKYVDDKSFIETIASKPKLIVVYPNTFELLARDKALISKFDSFEMFLNTDYKKETSLDGWDVYKRINN